MTWEVVEKLRPPRYIIEEPKGKATARTFRETKHPDLRAPNPFGNQGPKIDSVFKLELKRNCLIGGGQAASKGDIVVCYAPTAASLWSAAKIISEERPI